VTPPLRVPFFFLVLSFLGGLADPGHARAQSWHYREPGAAEGLFASGIFTADLSSTEGAATLLLPIGPKAMGMTRAVTATRVVPVRTIPPPST